MSEENAAVDEGDVGREEAKRAVNEEAVENAPGEARKQPPPLPEPAVKSKWPKRIAIMLFALFACVIALSWDSLQELISPMPWTGSYMITTSEYEGSEITKDGGKFTARFNIDVVKKDGWKKIPLLPSAVAIHSASLPAGAYLHLADGMYSVLTKRRGKLDVSITFAVAAKEADGANTINFERVPSVTCLLKAALPGDNFDVTVAGAQSTRTAKTNGQMSVVAALPDNTPVKITWKESLPKLAEGPAEIHSETRTLVSVTEGLLLGQARIDFSVLHKPTRELKLKVPAGVSVLEITGRNVRDWRVENGVMSVQLEKEVLGPYQMVVKFESPSSMEGGRLVIPVVTGGDAERDKGDVGIVALTSVEIRSGEIKNAHAIDVKELPAEIIGMTSQPVLLAYRYSSPDFKIALDVNKHKSVEVLLTVIDRANFTVMQALDGKRIVRGVYNVRNNRNQFFRIALPKDAELWSASVAGRTVQPARDEQGRVLLPLVRSQGAAGMSAFPVEIVYAEKGVAPDERGCGTARVDLPVSAEPVMRMMATLYVPEQGKYDNFAGTMKRVDQFAVENVPSFQPVPRHVAVNAAVQLQVLEKPSAPEGGDVEIQFPVTGKSFLLEKILVVKDQQWFSYDFRKLTM